MRKTMQWLTVVVAAVIFLVGCQGTKEGAGDRNRQDNNTGIENTKYSEGDTARKQRRDVNDENTNINNNADDRDLANDDNYRSNHRSSNNTQDEYSVSKKAADRIVDEVADIDDAYVLTTKNNAYVAAVLDKDQTPNDPIAKNDRNDSSAGTNVKHTNDRNVKDRTVNDGDGNKRGPDNHMSNRKDRNDHDVTDNVKNEIAQIVQDVDNDIDNVYVTTSPDFVDLVGNYSDDMDNGKPVRGFFDQIGNTIERIFPQNKR